MNSNQKPSLIRWFFYYIGLKILEMNFIANCPNCTTPLKSSVFGGNKLFTEKETELINYVYEEHAQAFCDKCGNEKLQIAINKLNTELTGVRNSLYKKIDYIPVISTHHPYNWEYTILGMVTGQSTTGTGVFSELGASVADFLGGQANAFNSKLKQGENICFNQLRGQALKFGGNAIIGTDIDYSELGGGRGMLMVCMAGTLIKLHNLAILSPVASANIIKMASDYEKVVLYEGLLKAVK
jgi:uncharacterized protein YbjQ (UPF0145 family)